MYKKILCESFIEDYKSYHKTLFRELNIMLFDVTFLKECILHNDIRLDTDIVVSYLFKNNFEHLILKAYRIMFDIGVDVLTVDTFIGQIIKNLNDEQLKTDLRSKISCSDWKSYRIKAVKNRLKESSEEFRNKAIAHKLTKEMKELSVDLNDISDLLDAAIDVFDMISFYPLDFYHTRITKYSFIAERITVQEKSKQLLDLLLFSSNEIKHIDVQYRDILDKPDTTKIKNIVSQYNTTREEEDICNDLLLKSKIGIFTKVKLLEVDEFKRALLGYKSISDSEIFSIITKLKQKLIIDAKNDKTAEYKLSIIDSCIDIVSKAVDDLHNQD